MFKKQYQGGPYVEVFSAQGRDPVAQWKLNGSVKKEFDKTLKGYVYKMEGGSSTTSTRMQLPKTDKILLSLVQRYVVLQINVPSSGRLALELAVVDGGGCRRRIQLSTSLREISASPLNARVPLAGVLVTDQWVNLCVDVVSMVTGLFKGQSFKSLEGISLGGTCSLRRVFTLRAPPPDTTGHTHFMNDDETTEEIPRACQVTTTSVQTQVLTYSRLTDVASASSSESCNNPPESCNSDGGQRLMHVAFGSKVVIPDHVLSSRQSARTAPSTRQTSSGVHRDGCVAGVGLQPRPPTGPADPSLLKIQKKRVRMLHSGRKRHSTSQQRGTDRDEATPKHREGDNPVLINSVSDGSAVKDSGYDTVEPSDVMMTSSPSHDAIMTSPITSSPRIPDSELSSAANDSLVSDKQDDRELDQSDGRELDQSDDRELDQSDDRELDQSDLRELLYSFHSLPKSASAGRKEGGVENIVLSLDSSGRGATYEEDFLSTDEHNGSVNEQGSPFRVNEQGSPLRVNKQGSTHSSSDGGAVIHPVTQTRLSDDYDWRQYTSGGGGEEDLVTSLRTRLAGGVAEGVAPVTMATPQSNSSEMEGTLSGSMTLSSGWVERFKNATHAPMYDSLDTRGMGGMMSPALAGTLTDQSDLSIEGEQDEGEELELMYDPQLNCYYDPVTYKYYELAQ